MLTSQTFRKRTSYILIPLMVVYTFAPNFMYGSTSPGNDSSGAAPSPSTSMASNGTSGVSAEVSPLTGQLSLTFNCITLPGLSDDVGIDFSITGGGEPKRKIYNFPEGCTPNLSYINTEKESHKILYIDGSQRYVIDLFSMGKTESGLKYFKNYGVLKFETSSSTSPKAPDFLGKDGYAYVLTSLAKGSHQYFDYYGKLIGGDDRFGNHVSYAYKQISPNQNFTPYNAILSGRDQSDTKSQPGIIDSYGQGIDFSYGSGKITVTAPDGRKAVVDFSQYRSDKPQISVTNLTGRTTTMYYSKTEAGGR